MKNETNHRHAGIPTQGDHERQRAAGHARPARIAKIWSKSASTTSTRNPIH